MWSKGKEKGRDKREGKGLLVTSYHDAKFCPRKAGQKGGDKGGRKGEGARIATSVRNIRI